MLDLAYEIHLVQQLHKCIKKWNRKTVRYHPRRVQPDIHNGEEVPENNSQDDREKGEWESSSDECEADTENDSF